MSRSITWDFPFLFLKHFNNAIRTAQLSESFIRVNEIQEICMKKDKKLVIYISMGFGNPYGDAYSDEIVFNWVSRISSLGIQIISLADTVGVATPEQVFDITDYLVKKMPGKEIGVHLHSTPDNGNQNSKRRLGQVAGV